MVIITRPLNMLPTVARRSQARAVYGGVKRKREHHQALSLVPLFRNSTFIGWLFKNGTWYDGFAFDHIGTNLDKTFDFGVAILS